ncbi:MAG: hypothetical protein ABWZ42_08750 [Ilumatobacteraceae bacterium]
MRKRSVIVLAAIGMSLVACGSSDRGGDGVASLGTTPGTDADGADRDSSGADAAALEAPEDIEEAMALFQACMEDHGVEMPTGVAVSRDGDETIAVGGGGPVVVFNGNDGTPDGDDDGDDDGDAPPQDGSANDDGDDGAKVAPPPIDVEEFQAANEACRGHLENAAPQLDLTPEQEAAMEDARLEFEQCMEDQGVDLPEMAAGADDIGVHVEVFEDGDGNPAPPAIDPEEMEAASKICAEVYDRYPELEDVFGEGGSAAPVFNVTEGGEP